jgi:CheY-like chemotaxis protein
MVFNSTILCIDDDIDDMAFIQEAIKSYETAFEVTEAENGEQALAYLNEAKTNGSLPCLIIMDINMPKMDGKKAIQLIKADKDLSTIPLVVFTTSSNISDKRYFELYNVQYITKPNHYSAFRKKVTEMLSQIAGS